MPQTPGSKKRPLILAVAVFVALLAGVLASPPASPAAAAEVRRITLPIDPARVDELRWTDSWGAPRSGGRSHIGVDMLGRKMIPLLAARSGVVTWGRFDNGRGSIVRFRDDEGWEYQYIHLNNDSPGTDDGQAACTQTFSPRICAGVGGDGRLESGLRLFEGEVIAYMGDGGNAENTTPHLHFEIYKPTGGGQVEAINPTPSVDAALSRLRSTGGGGGPAYAEPGRPEFVEYLWNEVFGHDPSLAERTQFEAAASSRGAWRALAERLEQGTTAASIDRLYLAFFLRYPDVGGLQYWIRVRGSGVASEAIAEEFARSAEFQQRYAGTNFSAFLDQLYQEVLKRAPDQGGKQYWLDLLQRGLVTRGTIVVYFTESVEMRQLTSRRNEIVALSLLRRGNIPTAGDLATWTQLRSSLPAERAIQRWWTS
jgi:hypothetical protein